MQHDPTAKRELPTGYDSLYIHAAGAAAAGAGAGAGAAGGDAVSAPTAGDLTSGDGYRHSYVVFDAAQVLPRYVVHFGYSPKERFHRTPVAPINLAEIKAKVAEALALLGPAAPAATEKMLSDIGE